MDDLLRVTDVARRFDVTPRTVRNWIAEGKITACRPGGNEYRIDAHSLDYLYKPVLTQPKWRA